jgi:hypothetical protein
LFDSVEPTQLDVEDIFSANLAMIHANKLGQESLANDLQKTIDPYFAEDNIDTTRIVRATSEEYSINPKDARELYAQEARKICESTEKIAADEENNSTEESIRIEQKQFLVMLLSKISVNA